MKKKLVDFASSISDVKVVKNSLFSTCKVRVMYTGRNRNLSTIEKDAVERALPSLINIPIVGEFSVDKNDFKGHGGTIDASSWDFIHTTKPYGIVPESATFEWEMIGGREYLTVNDCLLWTGRYPEAYSIIEESKNQSMEIEVTDGEWLEDEDSYKIKDFIFSSLCILGDDVTPAFEDAKISAYSFENETFNKEFSILKEEVLTLEKDKEVDNVLKELLEKYSTSVEELTAKGLVFSEISENELEDKIIEALAVKEEKFSEEGNEDENKSEETDKVEDNESEDNKVEEDKPEEEDKDEEDTPDDSDGKEDSAGKDSEEDKAEDKFQALQDTIDKLEDELKDLRQFKSDSLKSVHEDKAKELFSNFQLTEEDIKGLDIHLFSIDEIEEKCYAILGKKLAVKKNFSKNDESQKGIKLPIIDDNQEEDSRYGSLLG